jgi:chorismate synthase
LFRVAIWGESHGEAVGATIDGCPAGLPLAVEDFVADLARRWPDLPGVSPRREPDRPRLLSGVCAGCTTGAPLTIAFENATARPVDYEQLQNLPRPGHADLPARRKFGGWNDPRGGGHFSGRLTVGLTAAGVVAKKLLAPIAIHARVVEIGGTALAADADPSTLSSLLSEAAQAGDSLGGVVECRAGGLPVGLGEPFFDSVESIVSHLVFAIPGVKAIEFGAGFSGARLRGSQFNDPIVAADGPPATNHAGGVNGGLTNGADLVFRVAVRPTASIALPQQTIDLRTGAPAELRTTGRHDGCIAVRVPVILEAACATALADLMLIEQRLPRIAERR